jgi:pentatricopeptide repeat protein
MNSNYVAQNGRPNRQTYNILVNFFAATRQPVMAERFIDKMRESGFKPDVDLFTATVSAYERTQQPLKAVKLMKRMEEDGYDFYSVKVLNTAFKKAVGLVNAVGQSFASPIDIDSSTELDTDLDDGDITDDEFVS